MRYVDVGFQLTEMLVKDWEGILSKCIVMVGREKINITRSGSRGEKV